MKPLYYKRSKAAKQIEADEYDDLEDRMERGRRSKFGRRENKNSPRPTRNQYEPEEGTYSFEDGDGYDQEQIQNESQMYDFYDDDVYFEEVERGQSFQYGKQPGRKQSNYLGRGYELGDSDSDCLACQPKTNKRFLEYNTENPSDFGYQQQKPQHKYKYKEEPTRKFRNYREPQHEQFQYDRMEKSNTMDSFHMKPSKNYQDGYHQYFQTVDEETEGESLRRWDFRNDIQRENYFQPTELDGEVESDQFVQINKKNKRGYEAEFDKQVRKSKPYPDKLNRKRSVTRPNERLFKERGSRKKNKPEILNEQIDNQHFSERNPIKRFFQKTGGKASNRKLVGGKRHQHQNINVYLANHPTEHSAFQINQQLDLNNKKLDSDVSENVDEEEEIEEEQLPVSRTRKPMLQTEYEVYAAQVDNEETGVFKSTEKTAPRERLISITDYASDNIPMIALKNSLVKTPDKNQSVIYLPVVIVDEKSQLRDFKRLSTAFHSNKPSTMAEKPLETNIPVYVATENYGNNIFQQQADQFQNEIRESVAPLQSATNTEHPSLVHSPKQSTGQEETQCSNIIKEKSQNTNVENMSIKNENKNSVHSKSGAKDEHVWKDKDSDKLNASKEISLGIIQEPLTVYISRSRQSVHSFARRLSKTPSTAGYPVQKSYINVVPAKNISSKTSVALKSSKDSVRSHEKLLGQEKLGSLRGSGFYSNIHKQDIQARKEKKGRKKWDEQSGKIDSPSYTPTSEHPNSKESNTIKLENPRISIKPELTKQESKSIFRFPSKDSKADQKPSDIKRERSRNDPVDQNPITAEPLGNTNKNYSTASQSQHTDSEPQEELKTSSPPSVLKKESKTRHLDSVGSKGTTENIYILPPKSSSQKSKKTMSTKASSKKPLAGKSSSVELKDNTEKIHSVNKWGYEESPIVYIFQIMNYFLGLSLHGTLMETLRTF